ncbi:putative MFS family arabinose efflux permease [Paraburkholderia sp. BL18I3N2]|uniref:MFS transporter n=1 Tax=Paraburkholderia sp. BL18I3N2 TaxID=1938799 RepID=UPI000D083D93|nr:MFS transporter [Paraburkholderia sp. BL18I3N2]PRX27382.1 putative MFS family arabinose efflux permease [Paraburkholderia sp. BL18I3N2]
MTSVNANTLGKSIVVVSGPSLVALIPMAVAPAMPAIASAFPESGDGAFFAQMVMAAPAIMVMLGAPIGGWVSDRVGRRIVLLTALALFVAAGIFPVLAPSAISLIVSRLVLGGAGGAILTSTFALAGDYVGHARERILGFAGAGAASCAIIAMTFGGRLVDAFGWRGPFILYLMAVPVLLLSFFVVSGGPSVREAKVAGKHSVRGYIPIYALTCVLSIGLFMPGIQGPFLLNANGINSAATIGMILSSYSLTAAFAAACYGPLRRVLTANSVLALAAFSLGAGSLALAASGSVAQLLAGCIVTGVGAGLVEPVTVSLILGRAHPDIRQRAVGFLLSSVFLGQFLNPVVLSPLRAAFDVHGAFVAVGFVFVVFSVLILSMGIGKSSEAAGAAASAQN